MSDLKIEAGKFYKTRGGSKVIVYEVIPEANRVVGATLIVNDRQCHHWFLSNGSYVSGSEKHRLDLIAPWIDPPVVDWDRFPAHIVAVAMDKDGIWQGYPYIPVPYDNWWSYKDGDDRFAMCSILIRDIPKFFGCWRNSLVVRPGWEK